MMIKGYRMATIGRFQPPGYRAAFALRLRVSDAHFAIVEGI